MKDIIGNDNKFSPSDEEPIISIAPIDLEGRSERLRKTLLELQLMMATSSINHEYARMEFEDADSHEKKEELLEYMNDCRTQYFRARSDLEKVDPYALIEFEKDLLRQKNSTLTHYNA